MKKLSILLLISTLAGLAQKAPLQEIVEAARANSPALKELLPAWMPTLRTRGAVAVWGQDYVFAVDAPSATSVAVSLKNETPISMTRVGDTSIWYHVRKMGAGGITRFRFYANGQPMTGGDNFSYDAVGYGPDSYPQPGVPRGKLSEMKTQTSELYPGMTSNFWVYTNPGVDTGRGAPLMVWLDGETMVGGADLIRKRVQIVTDNLVYQKRIPPMVHVFTSPGRVQIPAGAPRSGRGGGGPGADGSMRSVLYDTVSPLFGRYVKEEILPLVEKEYKVRQDAYSRAIEGISSGGICAWNTAWEHPDLFSRVLAYVSTFSPLQERREEHLEGGNIVPTRVRLSSKKNIRVWLGDSTDDNNVYQNIVMANSLKMRGYDFHFRFNNDAMHSVGQEALDLPDALTWLWRGYDEKKTEQVYEPDSAEQGKPYFRVKIVNRDAW